MKRTLALIVILQSAAGLALGGDEPSKQPANAARADDERAIRAANDVFVRAYNAGDSKRIGEMFPDHSEAVDADGNEVQGRKAIVEVFDTIFEEMPRAKLEIVFESLKFLGPDVAVEYARTKLTPRDGTTPEFDRFLVLIVKQNGRWAPTFIQEVPDRKDGHHEQLKQLEWMVGEWVDQSNDMDLVSSCQWSNDGNYLLRLFTIRLPGKPPISGTQRIGWDPLSNHVRSWVFDTDGGFGEGTWTRNGDQWTIKESTVLGDARKMTSTHVFTLVAKDRVRWKSVDRTIDGKPVRDLEETTMVRKSADSR